jgi:DNA-binding NarL/FixJ family response regulator
VKILIADDHELFRDGIQLVLKELSEDLEIFCASTHQEALEIAGQHKDSIDLVLLDLIMPGMPWADGLLAMKKQLGKKPIVILSSSSNRSQVLNAVKLGAAGYIPKTSSSRVMLGALRLVLDGGVYLPAQLLDETAGQKLVDLSQDHAEDKSGASGLTPRQKEVLVYMGKGKSNKEIARTLNLSEGTVKLHVTAILRALNVSNRTSAVVAANKLGIFALTNSGDQTSEDDA